MRAFRIALIGCALVLGLMSPAEARGVKPAPVDGVFVGQVLGPLGSPVFIAIVAGEEGVLAYLCDDKKVGAWFSSDERSGNSVELTSKDGTQSLDATLFPQAAAGWVTYKGHWFPFIALRAHGEAGLYRSEGDINGADYLAGWIVLKNGRQVGVVTLGGLASPAPALNTVTLAATLGASQIGAAQVVTPVNGSVLILDLAGDGIDVGGQTQTSLLSGTPEAVRWSKPGDDDSFLVVNATALRTLGYEIRTASGQLVDGMQLVGGGRLKDLATGVTTVITDAWQMIKILDKNKDGVLDPQDPAWAALRMYTDTSADGDIDAADLKSMATAGIGGISLSGLQAAVTDAFGNILVRGAFRLTNGTVRVGASVVLHGL
jgi:serine/threonine-protein kinase